MKKQRPEYVAWEKLIRAQIAASESAIKCLMAEVKATRELARCQRRLLKQAQKDEAKL